jgi:hypothetical protein
MKDLKQAVLSSKEKVLKDNEKIFENERLLLREIGELPDGFYLDQRKVWAGGLNFCLKREKDRKVPMWKGRHFFVTFTVYTEVVEVFVKLTKDASVFKIDELDKVVPFVSDYIEEFTREEKEDELATKS